MKNRLLKSLGFLKSYLGEEGGLAGAFAQIKEAIEEGEWPEEGQNSSEHFVLPTEVAAAGGLALFSDGACRGNPGPGAWGVIGQVADGELIFENSGVDILTTNNRMELLGAIEALKAGEEYCRQQKKKTPVWLYSDSRYTVDGMNSWVAGWKRRHWRKADKKVPDNVELWQELDRRRGMFEKLSFVWVKGHDGHPQNEYCDRIANHALDDAGLFGGQT